MPVPACERALSAVPRARAGPLAAPNRVGRSSWVYRWAVSPIGGMARVQVLILPRRLQRELGMGMIFVTHAVLNTILIVPATLCTCVDRNRRPKP